MLYMMSNGPRWTGRWVWDYFISEDPAELQTMTEPNYCFDKDIMRKGVGDVWQYEGSITEDGIKWTKHTGQWVVRLEDTDRRNKMKWTAAASESRRMAQKRAVSDDWKLGLDPVREAYRSATGVNRNHLIAQVIRYLCS